MANLNIKIGIEISHMIRIEKRAGKQIITEICDTCKCHIQNLDIDDIMVKPKSLSGVTLKDTKGNEVVRTGPRPKCHCMECKHD